MVFSMHEMVLNTQHSPHPLYSTHSISGKAILSHQEREQL